MVPGEKQIQAHPSAEPPVHYKERDAKARTCAGSENTGSARAEPADALDMDSSLQEMP